MLWTPVKLWPSPTPEPPLRVSTRLVWYDEAGKIFRQDHLELLPSEMLDVPELSVDRDFGWVAIVSDSESFVTGHYTILDEYSASLHAWCLPQAALPDAPDIVLYKRVQGQDADVPPGPTVPVASELAWTFEVVNVGSVLLDGVAVDDASGLVVSCPQSFLEVGESMVCSAASLAAGCQNRNEATATAVTAAGGTVGASDVAHYYGEYDAAVALETRVEGNLADTPPGPSLQVGRTIALTYEALNEGGAPLTAVAVTDSHGLVVSCPKATLEPGEAMTCTATTTVLGGPQVHVGTVTASAPCEEVVRATDPAHYVGMPPEDPQVPAIDIEKLVNGQDADLPPGPSFPVGTPLLWTYVVTNVGALPLTGVTVTDDRGVAVSCPKTVLAVDEAMTCTGSGTAAEGAYVNVGIATGTPPEGGPVSDQDPCHYTGQPPPVQLGCSPGYWKNHPASWPPTGYGAGQSVASVFSGALRFPALASATLYEALGFDGGAGDVGAAEILLRAAVAAALNAAHPDVPYPRSTASVIADTDAALGGSRDAMLALAAAFDADNNLGCPLD
jgi:hypothetical protein